MTRFFYGDGTISDNTPSKPNDVQAIVQHTDHDGWFIASGGDWYVEDNGEWLCVDIYGALDWMMQKGYLLQGRTITDKNYSEIMTKAIEYRDGVRNV